MSQKVVVFLIRAGLGILGGWFLTSFFFTPKDQTVNWFIVVVLAAIVVAAAYLSEMWRARKSR